MTMGNYFGFFTFGKIFDYAKIPYVYSAENKQLPVHFREPYKYYFADFVRKGGGGTPQIRNPLFPK